MTRRVRRAIGHVSPISIAPRLITVPALEPAHANPDLSNVADAALAFGGKHLTRIALWNGEAGDAPGGTEDMIEQANPRGATVTVPESRALFGL